MTSRAYQLPSIILFCCLVSPIAINAQEQIINLDLARYYYRVEGNDLGVVEYDENEHSGMFPNGSYYMWTVSHVRESLIFGEIVLANGEERGGYDKMTGDGYFEEEPFGIWEISKYEPPIVMVDGKPSSPEYTGLVDESIKADKMFRVFKKKSPWMHIRYEGYQFVNQLYGDFVVLKSTFKLTFDDDDYPQTDPDPDADTTQVVKDIYVLKAYRIGQTSYTGKADDDPNGSWFIHHGAWWASTMEVPSIIPDADRDKLIVTYAWDGNHPTLTEFTTGGPLFDDTGYPRWQPAPDGWLMSPTYSGFTLLHCDQSPADKSDWVDGNPYSSRINFNDYDYRETRDGGLWKYFITGCPDPPYEAKEEYPPEGNPVAIEGKMPVQIWGGWPELRMGDSVTVVHALGSGSISRKEAREVGAAWANWYQKGDDPKAYYDDPDLGHILVTDQIKNDILHRGKDSLATAMQRVQELWENDLVCPRPYPSPDLYIYSAPNAVRLEWTDVEEDYPGHEGGNVLTYRIYRKMGHFWDDYPNEAGKNIYWKMIVEIPEDALVKNDKGYFEYTDAGLTIGENYFYAVTAVSDVRAAINPGPDEPNPYLESSRWSNRSQLPAVPFRPGKSYLDSVVVVPNPYYIKGDLMNFVSDNNQLMFANLPPFCTLRIYNVTGDLVHKIEHDSGTSSEFWDQITATNQYIASGVYVLVVTDAQKLVADEEGKLEPENLPGKTIVKFTVIR